MGEVCNKGYLTVRNNSVANCRRLGTRISTGLEVFAMPKGECRFNSCSRPQKIAVVLQNFKRINTGIEGNCNG